MGSDVVFFSAPTGSYLSSGQLMNWAGSGSKVRGGVLIFFWTCKQDEMRCLYSSLHGRYTFPRPPLLPPVRPGAT